MWSYYGAKTNIIDKYPVPKYAKIIEPFAGSARYALKYWDREILLVDRYKVITDIWQWLQLCSTADILKLPRKINSGQSVQEMGLPCRQAELLYGFLMGKGIDRPRKHATRWEIDDRPNFINYSVQRIASNLHKIKHWQICNGDYQDIRNEKATWFIDPPYQVAGYHYPWGSAKINYGDLASFCRSRDGQVMVCEGPGAVWLPFNHFLTANGRSGKSEEFIYLQEEQLQKIYEPRQQKLF